MMKTILQPTDISKFTPITLPFNACTFQQLWQIEEAEAIGCLGWDLYNRILQAAADYSSAPEYAAGAYLAGDVVKWRGGYMQALVNTENTPDTVEDWQQAPRFAGEYAAEYDGFFCRYLAPFLSYRVLGIRLPYIWVRITDMGTVQYDGNNWNTAEDGVYTRLQRAVERDRATAWRLLESYLLRLPEEQRAPFAGFPPYLVVPCGIDENNCDNGKQRTGRYRFG